jgi:ATP-dependent Lhr-like helicase
MLWKEAWKGNVTSDTFRTIRKGVMTGFKPGAFGEEARLSSVRTGFSRWKLSRPLEGHWKRIDVPKVDRDIIGEEELMKDRARQLLRRHGILFREILANELPPFQWRAVFRALRLMDLSGEVLSGYFFEGIPGPQFISHEAFRMLQDELPQDSVFWINAADPASLCGLGLRSQGLPPRIVSNYLVYHGNRVVMILRRLGKNLDIFVPPDDPRLADYFVLFKDLLTREFKPAQKISIETINGESALGSPHAGALKQFGFRSGRTGLELWKQY